MTYKKANTFKEMIRQQERQAKEAKRVIDDCQAVLKQWQACEPCESIDGNTEDLGDGQ